MASVEVRELIIRASVEQDGEQPGTREPVVSGNSMPGEELIRICVDKILEILKEKDER